MSLATNVWAELDELEDGIRGARLERVRGETLAAAVWELDPGAESTYHFHHGTRELLLVLRGRLTLRTHEGERELVEGDVVAFPRGRDGANAMVNRPDAPVSYVVVAHHESTDVIEYPDRGEVAVMARSTSESAQLLQAFFRAADSFQRES